MGHERGVGRSGKAKVNYVDRIIIESFTPLVQVSVHLRSPPAQVVRHHEYETSPQMKQ